MLLLAATTNKVTQVCLVPDKSEEVTEDDKGSSKDGTRKVAAKAQAQAKSIPGVLKKLKAKSSSRT